MDPSYYYGINNPQTNFQNIQPEQRASSKVAVGGVGGVVFSESDWTLVMAEAKNDEHSGSINEGYDQNLMNRVNKDAADLANVDGVRRSSSNDQQFRLIPIILQHSAQSLVTLKPLRLEQLLDEAAVEFKLDRTLIHLAVLVQQIPIKISQSIYSRLGPLSKVQVQVSNLQSSSSSSRLWNSYVLTQSNEPSNLNTDSASGAAMKSSSTAQMISSVNGASDPSGTTANLKGIDFSTFFGSTIPQPGPNHSQVANNFLMNQSTSFSEINPTIDMGELDYSQIFNTTTAVSNSVISPAAATTTISTSPISHSTTLNSKTKSNTPPCSLAVPSPAPSDSSMITVTSKSNNKQISSISDNNNGNNDSNNNNSKKRFLITRSSNQQPAQKPKFPFHSSRKDLNESNESNISTSPSPRSSASSSNFKKISVNGLNSNNNSSNDNNSKSNEENNQNNLNSNE